MAIAALDEASFNHDVELLVIDNGSSDNTAEVLAHIEPLNMTLRYLSEPTAGVCRAKNLGYETPMVKYSFSQTMTVK